MNKAEFKEFTRDEIRILDGATGSFLLAAGMPENACTEKWVLENPDVIMKLQKQYAEAGSDIIYAPTFGANAIRLRHYGLSDQVERFNKEGVKLTRKIAGSALVCGDVSMSGDNLEPYGDLEFEELVDAYRQQLTCLEEAGCDLICAETLIDLNEAKAVLIAAQDTVKIPVMVTMAFEANQHTLYGNTPKEAADVLSELGASAIGANCSTGPDQMLPVIETMADAVDLPIIAKPNAGLPKPTFAGSVKYDIDPGNFAIQMTRLVSAGANIVGGCCGTGPEYIRQLSLLCENMTFRSK